MTLRPLLLLVGLLAACGDKSTSDPFTPHTFGELATWGTGIEGFEPAPVGDTGGAFSFDGDWTGTYTFNATLNDYGYSCSCTANVTLRVREGEVLPSEGDSCSMDCGITSQLRFRGVVGGDGGGGGTVIEETSFYFTTPWSGTFAGNTGTASWSQAGVSTDQGSTDVSGSFTVTRGGGSDTGL